LHITVPRRYLEAAQKLKALPSLEDGRNAFEEQKLLTL
jgi:hypothetical protein